MGGIRNVGPTNKMFSTMHYSREPIWDWLGSRSLHARLTSVRVSVWVSQFPWKPVQNSNRNIVENVRGFSFYLFVFIFSYIWMFMWDFVYFACLVVVDIRVYYILIWNECRGYYLGYIFCLVFYFHAFIWKGKGKLY